MSPRREPARIIVRRDRGDLYELLRGELAELDAEVVWDRRRRQRRQALLEVDRNRRQRERRQEPPAWRTLGVIVLPRRRSKGESRPQRYAIVVRRGCHDVFERLSEVFGSEAVRWDPRRGDRRVATVLTAVNRRRQDRRSPPSRRWVTAGVVVAVADHRTVRAPEP